MEFTLPDLSRPDRLAASIQEHFHTPNASPSVARELEQLDMGGNSKSESGKRKIKIEEGDSACSTLTLMGGSTKKGKHE